jgi:hypothetical protein
VFVPDGHVVPGFEAVRDAFAANFDQHRRRRVRRVRRRRPVVDLWGGFAADGPNRILLVEIRSLRAPPKRAVRSRAAPVHEFANTDGIRVSRLGIGA